MATLTDVKIKALRPQAKPYKPADDEYRRVPPVRRFLPQGCRQLLRHTFNVPSKSLILKVFCSSPLVGKTAKALISLK